MINYGGELHLLCDTLRRLRISTSFIINGDKLENYLDSGLKEIIGIPDNYIRDTVIDKFKENTVYKIKIRHICFLILKLPFVSQKTLFSIGPYLNNQLTNKQILEMCEQIGVSPEYNIIIEKYYTSLPVLNESSAVFPMIDCFCESLWGKNNYTITEKSESEAFDTEIINYNLHEENKSTLSAMKLMEERYAAENELLRAVSQGSKRMAKSIMSAISIMPFETRLDDPIRNLKNYSIIMNTLLRKAAEKGGVHPIHLDRISSSFAVKIEKLPTIESVKQLMSDMFNSYCNLVNKFKMKDMSSAVKKAILQIDSELSGELSLRTLAHSQNISPSYLSALFKKETGKTVTEYINSERMNYAAFLIETTNLQIQTVALHCGILDVQYFSKLFKKFHGITPKEYRVSSPEIKRP